MKKKAISQIPYMTAKKAPTRRPKKKYDYVAAVERKNISHESHLFIEIYRNEKDCFQIPICRYVYTKKDWCKFSPESGVWQKTKMRDIYGKMSWQKTNETTYISDENIAKIKNFTGKEIYNKSNWWEYTERLESHIRHMVWQRKMKAREDRLAERCSLVQKLPEGFTQWYKGELFKNMNFLYYKRKGRNATFYCSHCGKSYTLPTKRKETYEGQFEHVTEVPRNGNDSVCKKCGAKGTYKTVGNTKNVYGMQKYCYVGQQIENGMVFRYLQVEKIFSVNTKERLTVAEIARTFIREKEKPVTDFHLYNRWTGREEWHDHNIGGIGSQITLNQASIFPETFKQLKGTFLKYSGVENYIKEYDKIKIADYMKLYQKMPFMEMFSKAGMHKLVESLVMNGNCCNLYTNGKSPHEILGIKKEKIKFLIREQGETDLLRVLQKEKEWNQNWTEEECKELMEIWPSWPILRTALEHMTMKKFLNRVEKYAGWTIKEVRCAELLGHIKHIATTYLDYLQMRISLGYDIDNSIIQHPRDLEAEHAKMVLESNRDAIEKRGKEVGKRFPQIEKQYNRLRERYYFEDGNYLIRPAKSAAEIVMEGRELHHCVGRDSYLKKHNDGTTTILLLRCKDKPEIPYITVEIEDSRILQWYGAYDKKPDRKKIDEWLDNWVKMLRTRVLTAKASEQIAG